MLFDRDARGARYLGRILQNLDKTLFLAVFLLGLAYIGLAKWLEISQVWVTLGPILLMLSYATALGVFRRLRVEAAQAGDNLYYLGFLFTLCSLAMALYFSGTAANREYIIQNFGIALFTTIIGLMLRVVCGQMQHDPVETEIEVRQQLVEQANKLRNDIIQVRSAMDVALIAVQQQSSEAVARYVNQLNEVVSDLVAKTTSHLKVFSEEASNFNNTSSRLVGAVESLVERVNQVNAPSDLLTSKLSPSVQAIGEAADEIRKRAKADKGLVDKLVVAIDSLSTAAQSAETSVHGIVVKGSEAEEVFGRLADIAQKFDQAATAAQANLEHTQKMVESQENIRNNFEQVLNSAVARLADGSNVLATQQERAFSQMEQAFSDTLQRIRTHNDSLAAELERSKNYTSKVHTALVSMTQAVTKQVSTTEP